MPWIFQRRATLPNREADMRQEGVLRHMKPNADSRWISVSDRKIYVAYTAVESELFRIDNLLGPPRAYATQTAACTALSRETRGQSGSQEY
jgi:hypothetical protein